MFLSVAEHEKRHFDIRKEVLKGLDIHMRDLNLMKNIKTIFDEYKDETM
jgi:uncharacterized ferritin-like protein (DUF455 family)